MGTTSFLHKNLILSGMKINQSYKNNNDEATRPNNSWDNHFSEPQTMIGKFLNIPTEKEKKNNENDDIHQNDSLE